MELYIREFNLQYVESVIENIIKSDNSPYPVYLTTEYNNFIHNLSPFKGIFIIESQKYYSGSIIKKFSNNIQHIGFFMTYEYGKVDYTRRPTLTFNIVYTFDYNPDIDHYGAMILKYIDWFVEKHTSLFSCFNINDCNLISTFEYLSKPIYRIEGGISSFVRRSVVFNFRGIFCFNNKCGD